MTKNKNLHINPLLFLTECLGGAAYNENRRITFRLFSVRIGKKFYQEQRMQKLSEVRNPNSSNERVFNSAIEPLKPI